MKVEVAFVRPNGSEEVHTYEASSAHLQLWREPAAGKASVKLFDTQGRETGQAIYSTVVFVRRGSAVEALDVPIGDQQ